MKRTLKIFQYSDDLYRSMELDVETLKKGGRPVSVSKVRRQVETMDELKKYRLSEELSETSFIGDWFHGIEGLDKVDDPEVVLHLNRLMRGGE